MREIEDESVDMILCDLPYGKTSCKWDSVIPFDELWMQYKRVAKKNAAIVLTAAQPFTSSLIMSNEAMFRYNWVWQKEPPGTGFANARYQPLRDCEDVCVFYEKRSFYYPQMTQGAPYKATSKGTRVDGIYGQKRLKPTNRKINKGERFPTQILKFAREKRFRVHPTQKPVALFEYLIKTYTLPGQVVLDNCSGSGTTAIACMNTRRNFICIEQDEKYVYLSRERVRLHREELFRAACVGVDIRIVNKGEGRECRTRREGSGDR